MTRPEELHREAMSFAEQADLARLHGDALQHRALVRRAFELERDAAGLVAETRLEPTRSVLHRSAASLALEAQEFREAERLIGTGLGGSPPDEILSELRSLLNDLHFHRRLAEEGITLEPNELQLTLIGGQVGTGIAPSGEFMRRVELFDRLVFRTAERHAGRAFRKQGRRDPDIQRGVELFIKVPQAASFAVNFKLGHRGLFEEVDAGPQVVGDIVRSFDHFARSEVRQLRALIPDESYFKNFVAVAKQLGPDGSRVETVGLAAQTDGSPRSVVLKPTFGAAFVENRPAPGTEPAIERVTVTGTLLLADAEGKRWGKIDVVPDDGHKQRFLVAPEIMADIVRPYFDTTVVVVGHRRGTTVYLDEINRA